LNACGGSTLFCAQDEPVNWHASAVPKNSANFEMNFTGMNLRIRPA
jgi:hypothetical protein